MRNAVIIVLTVALVLAAIAALYLHFFVDMKRLPEGELVYSCPSPRGDKTVNLYLCAGSATTADSIRGEIVIDGVKRNIYWQYREDRHECSWESDDVVNINGVTIDVLNGSYDWRRIGYRSATDDQ